MFFKSAKVIRNVLRGSMFDNSPFIRGFCWKTLYSKTQNNHLKILGNMNQKVKRTSEKNPWKSFWNEVSMFQLARGDPSLRLYRWLSLLLLTFGHYSQAQNFINIGVAKHVIPHMIQIIRTKIFSKNRQRKKHS